MEFLQTLGVMLTVALIPLVLYALTKVKRDFDVITWIIDSRTRLGLGFVLIVLISILVVFVPESEAVLTAIGFNPDKSSAALGLAIGGLLVAGIRGNED